MKRFQHFILTRFNLGLYSNQRKDKNHQLVNHNDWMEERFVLFDQYCFPSIRSQVNQNFKWLVLFDASTPEKFWSQIRKYQKYSNFIPLRSNNSFTPTKHVEGFSDFWSYIRNHLDRRTSHLITTRIDNDDALHRRATQLIQAQIAALHTDSLAIDFPVGYCLQKDTLFIKRQPCNPFVTLIEKIHHSGGGRPFCTVLWIKHRLIHQIAPVNRLESFPMWIQVIHDRNLYNKTRGQPVAALLSPNDFGLKDPRLFKTFPT